ncbi:hypothetical protein [Nakamurella aerolata]|uniref:Uncharacterized protein n=1 Tax=Nakamurella aerolata TaxID=1656892 RepID=A0A849AHN4_9ACTN|nr:hypothetical protein [Nakamurella aerolata]NNG36342.1 hypothetical protein [Nakamurella aerolata]
MSTTALHDELTAQAANARDAGAAMAAIEAAIGARQRRRRLAYTAGAGVAAAAIILTPALLVNTPGEPTQPAAAQPRATSGLVAAATPASAPFALPQLPNGWAFARSDNGAVEYGPGGMVVSETSTEGPGPDIKMSYPSMIVVLLAEPKSAPGAMDRTVNGRQLLLRNDNTNPAGGRTVIVDVGRGLRAMVQFPASTADLPDQQLLQIASKVQIRDYAAQGVG